MNKKRILTVAGKENCVPTTTPARVCRGGALEKGGPRVSDTTEWDGRTSHKPRKGEGKKKENV